MGTDQRAGKQKCPECNMMVPGGSCGNTATCMNLPANFESKSIIRENDFPPQKTNWQLDSGVEFV